ncbi:MAG: amino acid ABC transporter ATP-binding protein, partial [Clostridia bacterium]|nr:amino acid ABC transporter ATP-binding protein [Clostridia bacterium]
MATPSNALIRVEKVSKVFPNGIHALDNCSLEIQKGEVVVIVGPSGSGKSTMLRSLNLLEEPTEGKIFFEDHDITDKKTNINLHRQKMGMVFQHFNLFPNMTVLKNLTLAPMNAKGVSREEAEATARKLLNMVGLGDRAEAYPQQL